MTTVEAGPGEGPAFARRPELSDDSELWLLRHGETEWSASGKHTGAPTSRSPSTASSRRAAMRGMLGDLQPALVLCSPRSRAQDTARLAGFADVEIDDDLVEWDYGAYEGRTTDEIREPSPGWDLFTHGVPGGETAAEVTARADRVLTRARRALPRGPVVLVGHGHFSRVLGARWIGLAGHAAARTCCWARPRRRCWACITASR